jgi:hypothetical protein
MTLASFYGSGNILPARKGYGNILALPLYFGTHRGHHLIGGGQNVIYGDKSHGILY